MRRTSTFNIPFRCQLHNPAILVETSQFFNRTFLFLSFLEQMARFFCLTLTVCLPSELPQEPWRTLFPILGLFVACNMTALCSALCSRGGGGMLAGGSLHGCMCGCVSALVAPCCC